MGRWAWGGLGGWMLRWCLCGHGVWLPRRSPHLGLGQRAMCTRIQESFDFFRESSTRRRNWKSWKKRKKRSSSNWTSWAARCRYLITRPKFQKTSEMRTTKRYVHLDYRSLDWVLIDPSFALQKQQLDGEMKHLAEAIQALSMMWDSGYVIKWRQRLMCSWGRGYRNEFFVFLWWVLVVGMNKNVKKRS